MRKSNLNLLPLKFNIKLRTLEAARADYSREEKETELAKTQDKESWLNTLFNDSVDDDNESIE